MIRKEYQDGGGGMRRGRGLPGMVIAGVGAMIILSMLLPAGFWWFALGVALIVVGLRIMKG